MILTLTGKYTLVLMIHSHHINFCISIEVIQPIGANAGWNKRNCSILTQIRKYIFANILVCKRYEFFYKVFFNLIQYDLHIIQFQFTLIRINITEPEADKMV